VTQTTQIKQKHDAERNGLYSAKELYQRSQSDEGKRKIVVLEKIKKKGNEKGNGKYGARSR
jgi:hypothetical protein